SAHALVVTSPATCTRPVVIRVSTATREVGSSPPEWDELRETLDAWSDEAPDHFLLHKGAVLVLEALDEVTTALTDSTRARAR
ncbi:hypothetical protein, partial [Streptomyces sp. NPDC039028]|uniref:hypothetical protein n=1 Tax=Streptomyces sp. NPDC039028 TaxID=3155370 RepID=UPI0033F3B292